MSHSQVGFRTFDHINRELIAQGSLNQLFTIMQRKQQPTQYNQPLSLLTMTPVTTISPTGQIMGRLKTIAPTSRMYGVNIDKTTITHLAYMNFDYNIFELELNTLYIAVEYPYGNGNRLFKALKTEDVSEMQKFLLCYCAETGYTGEPAASI